MNTRDDEWETLRSINMLGANIESVTRHFRQSTRRMGANMEQSHVTCFDVAGVREYDCWTPNSSFALIYR
jgi:hypothetical protein